MFGNQRSSSNKHSYFGWGIWLFIFGLGLLFFYAQHTSFPLLQGQIKGDVLSTPPAQSTPTKNTDENSSKKSQEEQSFLAEYDPKANTFLEENTNDDRPLWLSGGELALKLLLVIGLVYLALLGLRWLQKGQRKLVSDGGATIRVLETTGLAPGRALHLVVVGEKTLLIGATDHQVSLLAELADITTPLTEETSNFAETLAATQKQNKYTTSLDWRNALDNVRASIQRIGQIGQE